MYGSNSPLQHLFVKLQDYLHSPGAWGLNRARNVAAILMSYPDQAQARRELLRWAMSENPETRKRAADTARRISEKDCTLLQASAAQFAAILAETPPAESRTRWHLGLVVARTARSASEIATAAELMWLLTEDRSNVVRCSAVEGLGLLALRSSDVREQAEPYLHTALRSGTPAMKCRAREALAKLRTAY